MPLSRSRLRPLAPVLLMLALLTGCASSRPDAGGTPSFGTVDRERTYRAEDVDRRFRRAADGWMGVPHRMGGTSRRGVDCSGLVQNLYAEAMDVSLPRTTEAQVQTGTRVRRGQLQPGDVVFFKTGRKDRHSGVYLSDGQFVHASSSRGVMISDLDERYWRRTWWQARRMLPAMTAPAAGTRPTGEGERTGW